MSNASDDLPDPDTPETTVSDPRGRSTSTDFRLCSPAPRTEIRVTAALYRDDRRATGLCYSSLVMTPNARIRRPAIAFVLLSLLAVGPAGLVGQAPPPADLVARVRTAFVPDPRVAVFDVKAEAKEQAIELTGDLEQPEAKAALLKAFREAGYANVVDRIAMLPDPALADKPMGIVTVSVAVMKTKPSHSSELGNQLIMGMVVRTLKKEGGWYYVQSLDDRYLGWMETDHLAFVTKEQAEAFSKAARVIVTSLFAAVREQPATDAPQVSDLVVGDVMAVTATAAGGSWFAVQLPDGRKGFVSKADAADYAAWKSSRAITPRTSSRPPAGSWECRTCGAAPPRKASTVRGS